MKRKRESNFVYDYFRFETDKETGMKFKTWILDGKRIAIKRVK